MMVLSLFIIDLMGLFFYNKIGSIISIGDLPTTNIIEPLLKDRSHPVFFLSQDCDSLHFYNKILNLLLVFASNIKASSGHHYSDSSKLFVFFLV